MKNVHPDQYEDLIEWFNSIIYQLKECHRPTIYGSDISTIIADGNKGMTIGEL